MCSSPMTDELIQMVFARGSCHPVKSSGSKGLVSALTLPVLSSAVLGKGPGGLRRTGQETVAAAILG